MITTASNRAAGTGCQAASHNYSTQYGYNTFNSPVWSTTPDAGESNFYYDKLGRLVLSQNAKQKPDDLFSYTIYDDLSRITEVGQVTKDCSLSAGHFFHNSFDDWLAAIINYTEQITRTYYDDVDDAVIDPITSSFLPLNTRSRVVYSTFKTYYSALMNDHAIAYSYDIAGNVKSLLREVPALAVINQEYKRIDYDYDLLSGKVNKVTYNEGNPDQYFHQYYYDQNNRLTETHTSDRESFLSKEVDAHYYYYKHGPLARTELGTQKVQGIDYAYTIHGWLKGINASACSTLYDMGHDGTGVTSSDFAPDVFGLTLGYYHGDYASATSLTNKFEAGDATSGYVSTTAPNLYNGNIRMMAVSISQFSTSPMGYTYTYDQLHRVKKVYAWNNYSVSGNNWPGSVTTLPTDYSNTFSYDANGNITEQVRKGQGTVTNMDDLKYFYRGYNSSNTLVNFTYNSSGVPVDESETPITTITRFTNQLGYVNDNTGYTGNYSDDINDQAGGNYDYDKIGNLIKDNAEEIENITWSVYGKILAITRTANSTKPDLEFQYSPDGQRVVKVVIPKGAGKFKQYTYYVRDAQGNIMATYTRTFNHIIDYENIGYADINSELTAIVGNGNFGTFIIAEYPSATSLKTSLHSDIDGNSTLTNTLLDNLSFVTYLNTGSNLATLIAAYDDATFLNVVFDYAQSNSQIAALVATLCSNPPAPNLMEFTITNYYRAWLTAYNGFDGTGFATLYTGVTSTTFTDANTAIDDLVDHYDPSLVIGWISGNLGIFGTDCGIQTSILLNFDYNTDLKNLFTSSANFKTVAQNYYSISDLWTILDLG